MAEGPARLHRMEGCAVIGETEPLATDQRQALLLLLLTPLFSGDKLIGVDKWSCH